MPRNPGLGRGIPLGFFRPANDRAEENWRYDRQAPVLIRRCALIRGAVVEAVGDAFAFREVDSVQLRGTSQPIKLYTFDTTAP